MREIIAFILMAGVSITPFLGLKVSGAAVIIGVALFFLYNHLEGVPRAESGLDFAAIPKGLKVRNIWFWILLPCVVDLMTYPLSLIFAPDFLSHVAGRASGVLSIGSVAALLPTLVFLALGEEIANRAFFQKRLAKHLPVFPAILVTSLFFAIAHISSGETGTVIFDVVFVFINSILYGIVYHKTQNAWISTIAHVTANIFSVFTILTLV